MPRRRKDEPKQGRRGKGEGSITQRPDGTWRGYVTTGYGPKGATRKYYYGPTFAEVRDKVSKAKEDLRKALPLPGERETVGGRLRTWLSSIESTVRPTTFKSYSDIARLHLEPGLGHIRLAKLSPQHVQALLTTKQAPTKGEGGKEKPGLSPRRVQYIRAILRMALNQAVEWGDLYRNVASLAKSPRVEPHRVVPLAPDQIPLLLEAIHGDRLEALYTLALASGARLGELLGLRWADLDLDSATMQVAVSLQRVGGKLQLVLPKTEKSRRTLELPRFAVASLREHRTRQLEERLLAGARWQESGLVFTTGIGTPVDGTKVTRAFQAILKEHGLPRQRFHDLRHLCASLLFAQGVPAKMVMDTLGHSQIATTLDIYTHIMPGLRREVADRMEDAVAAHRG